jgi:phage FluMu gp28-like protein
MGSSMTNRTLRKSRKQRAEGVAAALSAPPQTPAPAARPRRPALLLPYQRRWVKDDAPLKIAVKARQTGYSFAATLRAVMACLRRPLTWIFLSKGERQSRLLMEKVAGHVRALGVAGRVLDESVFEGTSMKQLEVRFSNGSVIYGLPANPDTARGYSGNVTLDEFAFHADADKIYTALFPTITRGYGLEIISTPNGTQGKFYELAKAAGLVEPGLGIGVSGLGENMSARTPSPESRVARWSGHRTDIYEAARQGLKVDVMQLRAGCEDESAWQQEFCCQFVSTAENFFSPELLAACLSAEASFPSLAHLLASARGDSSGFGARGSAIGSGNEGTSSPESRIPSPEFFLGVDIGRRHDRTVFWVDEVTTTGGHPEPATADEGSQRLRFAQYDSREGGRVSTARLVRVMDRAPFAEQLAFARELMSLRKADGAWLIRRAALDATGIGAPLAEDLEQEFAPRVEPVVFTAAVKEDLAFRTRRRMEGGLTRLPDTREVRQAFSAVKKFVTPSGNLRFDAERTEAGHADEFWAKALADYAAAGRPVSSVRDAFLADGAPIFGPAAFAALDIGMLRGDF